MLGNSFESTKDRFKDLENSELLSKKQKLVIRWLFNHKSEVKRTEYITYYMSNYVVLIMWFNVQQILSQFHTISLCGNFTCSIITPIFAV